MEIKRINFNVKVISVFLVFLLALFWAKLDASQESAFFNPDITISMDFQDAGLKDILKILSIQSGLNFIASEGIQDRKVTLYMDKVPLKEAMDKIFKANNLSYDLDRNSNIFIVKDWGKPTVETVTKVFYLKYATVSASALSSASSSSSSSSSGSGTSGGSSSSGITDALNKIISSNGSVVEDGRINSLIITDVPSRMPVIAQTIAALDIPMAQIMLEVEMLDVNKSLVDKIGFKWGSSTASSILSMVLTGGKATSLWPFTKYFPLSETYRSHDVTKTLTGGSVDFSTTTYTMLLDLFHSQTDTKYLARPRILTLNNQTAELKITTNETIGVTTTTSSSQSTSEQTTDVPERTETGIVLKVTPQINTETGEITMFIYPLIKDTSTSSFTGSNSQPFKDPEERSSKSIVRVKDGDTVVIGGLIRKDKSETVTKMPFLGSIPFFGKAFTHRNKDKDKERELLVFITPHIIKDKNNMELAQAKKINLPAREQGSMPGVERQASIDISLNEYEKRKR